MRLLSLIVLVVTLVGLHGQARSYDGPIVDGHAHWGDSFDAAAIVQRYRAQGVIAQLVMPRYLGVIGDLPTTDESVLRIAERYPGHMFVMAGMQRPDFTFMDWNKPSRVAQNILIEIDKKLTERKVIGIGEILIRHWAYPGDGGRVGQHAEIDKTFDSVFIRQVGLIALKHDVPVIIHMEGYPELVKQLERVLSESPLLKLVWAHGCGRLDPMIIRGLLERHSSLHCDLSNMTNTGGYGSGWPRAESFTSKMEVGGVFLEPYRQLLIDFEGRFYIGMDVAHQSRWAMDQGNTFEKRVLRTRQLLGQLPSGVARKLAYENVIRLFKIPISPGEATR